MIEVPTRPPRWIDQPAALEDMLDDLRHYQVLAVDTESNSLYAYREQVCLIQFSTGKTDYLVDPLVLTDLSPLGKIFADPGIEKVFHAAEYDLICLKRDFNFEFSNIFDTMIAARILGRRHLSLAGLLNEEFGLKLDKRFQRANWGKRPLAPAMLSYARLDTYYLIPLRQRMVKSLQKRDRLPLAEEDFKRMCHVTLPQPSNGNGVLPPRMGGAKDLTKKQEAVMWELYKYRDKAAQAANLPPFKVFSNQTMLNLTLACPLGEKELEAVKGISPRQARRHAGELIKAVQRGLNGEPPKKNNNHRRMPDERFLWRLEALRDWRKQRGRQLGVESDVIMPREVMEAIAEVNPTQMGKLKETMRTIPWRYQRFGQEIMEVLNAQKDK